MRGGDDPFQQVAVGAPQASFSAYPDEPSHFLSGVMIRDYIVSGFQGSPRAFASNYYSRMPYFAVGYWPPVFYLTEALWMLVLGVGLSQALWLSAFLGAAAAITVLDQARRYVGWFPAACCAMLFLQWPSIRSSDSAIMTDTTVALLSLWASIALARFFERERTADALLFGVLAALTILTKYSGVFLVPVPVIAAVVAGRSDLLRRRSFWAMGIPIAALCLPWVLATSNLASRGFLTGEKSGAIRRMADYVLFILRSDLPFGMLLCAAWLSAILLHRRIGVRGLVWLVQAPAVIWVAAVSPVLFEERYLAPAIAPLILLGCAVIHSCHLRRAANVALPALAALTLIAYHPLRMTRDSVRSVATFVQSTRAASVLVPGDAEGIFIAEIAAGSQRGKAVLIRPSKILASVDWTASHYVARFPDCLGMEAFFERNPVDLMVLRDPPRAGAWPHEKMLSAMRSEFPERWHLVGRFPAATGSYLVYRYAPESILRNAR